MENPNYRKEVLGPAVAASFTWAEVCRKISPSHSSRVQAYVKNKAVEHGIDFSHFRGQGWSKGKRFIAIPLEDFLSNKVPIASASLRVKIIEAGLKDFKCEECGLTEWMGEEAPLDLDHINSDHDDNRLENLKVLCANCHRVKTRATRSARKKQTSAPSKKYKCKRCQKPKKSEGKTGLCRECVLPTRVSRTKIDWPSTQNLVEMIESESFLAVSLKLGVSDNAIRLHLKKRGIIAASRFSKKSTECNPTAEIGHSKRPQCEFNSRREYEVNILGWSKAGREPLKFSGEGASPSPKAMEDKSVR